MMPLDGVDAMRAADVTEAEAWEDFYAAAPPSFAARKGLRAERCGGAVVFHAPGMPRPEFNRAVGLGLFRAATPGDVDEVVGALRAEGARRFWVHAGGACEPSEIPAWLRERGLAAEARAGWAKAVRGRESLDEIPASAFRVSEIGREHAETFGRVLVDVHDLPAAAVGWFAALVGRPRWHAYGAFADDGTLAAGALLYAHGERAWLGFTGTLPAQRNRGAQGALLARRVRDALDLGCSTLVSEADEPGPGARTPSLSNMYRCGFRKVFSRENYAPV